MRVVELYATKGTFSPGEMIRLTVVVDMEAPGRADIRLSFLHLDEVVDTLMFPVSHDGERALSLEWRAPWASLCGYGLTAELLDPSGALLDSRSTAFDVLQDWWVFPRYGFLTDFAPGRADSAATLDALVRFHINGLQFYDWQYRHDTLLPPEPEYHDPLGRALSLETVREFIEAAHERGMAAMPYLAVYAASLDFWQRHLDWALYDAAGEPVAFEGFLGLMDPAPGAPWSEHLLGECGKVLAELPFDGLHVDQYGNPKEGFDAQGTPVDIPAAFAAFIGALKERHPRAAVVFNAVANWPIEALVAAPQDFVYIEVWPPDVFFRDVRRIVTAARAMSGGRAVVIALYLPADQPENVRLADALIFSLGGSRIELGERVRLLTDPYFPKHQAISPGLRRTLRRYYDFVVRYGELLGPTAGLLGDFVVKAPPEVWIIARTSDAGWLTLSLLNVSGLGEPRWDEPIPAPRPLIPVSVQFNLAQPITRCLWASPDGADLNLAPLPWSLDHETVTVTLPGLDHWAIVAIKLQDGVYS
jgi:dextranase